jgi:hypothetical protein
MCRESGQSAMANPTICRDNAGSFQARLVKMTKSMTNRMTSSA